jgi:hypothetical protein
MKIAPPFTALLIAFAVFGQSADGQKSEAPSKETIKAFKRIKDEGKPKKNAKPPTQGPITKDCVTVFDIYSHGLSFFSGVAAHEPGLSATVQNNCGVPVEVFLRIGYFDRNSVQFGGDIFSATVGSRSRYAVEHIAPLYGFERGRLKTAVIVAVEAFPL